jgi:hypothetical protein
MPIEGLLRSVGVAAFVASSLQMTLLLAAVAKQGIVISSDGLCSNLNTGKTISSDLQKVFPISEHALAIAHHGQNILAGIPVADLVQSFAKSLPANYSVEEVARLLVAFIGPLVIKTQVSLLSNGIDDNVGFWVAGFDTKGGDPELWEVDWLKKHEIDAGRQSPEIIRQQYLVKGGGGKDQAQTSMESLGAKNIGFSATDFDVRSLQWWSKYLETLYNHANANQKQPKVFGGKRHELSIEKSGWVWSKPP